MLAAARTVLRIRWLTQPPLQAVGKVEEPSRLDLFRVKSGPTMCRVTGHGRGCHIWGAHAPRVLAKAPSPSRTFPSRKIAARAPQWAREARALPRYDSRSHVRFQVEKQSSVFSFRTKEQGCLYY